MGVGNRNAFYIKGSSETEKAAMELIRSHFSVNYPELVMREVHGSDETALFMQKYLGDILWFNADSTKHSGFCFAEVKAEERHTGNLFLETWSNWSDEPDRLNPGWAVKVSGHYIFYVFLDIPIIYQLPRTETLRWVWQNHHHYPERTQSKASQKNKTRGVLVPLKDIFEHLDQIGASFCIHRVQTSGGKP